MSRLDEPARSYYRPASRSQILQLPGERTTCTSVSRSLPQTHPHHDAYTIDPQRLPPIRLIGKANAYAQRQTTTRALPRVGQSLASSCRNDETRWSHFWDDLKGMRTYLINRFGTVPKFRRFASEGQIHFTGSQDFRTSAVARHPNSRRTSDLVPHAELRSAALQASNFASHRSLDLCQQVSPDRLANARAL